jgi:hypothetical protein
MNFEFRSIGAETMRLASPSVGGARRDRSRTSAERVMAPDPACGTHRIGVETCDALGFLVAAGDDEKHLDRTNPRHSEDIDIAREQLRRGRSCKDVGMSLVATHARLIDQQVGAMRLHKRFRFLQCR